MSTFFQLVELSSGNVVDDFDNVTDAFESIAQAVETYGRDAMRTYSLIEVSDDVPTLVAMEDALLDRVDDQMAPNQPTGELLIPARTR